METDKLNAYVKLLWSRLLRSVTLHNALALEAGVPTLPEPETPSSMIAGFVSAAAIQGKGIPQNSSEFLECLDGFVSTCCAVYDDVIPGLLELAAIRGGHLASALKADHALLHVAAHGCRNFA